MNLKKTCLSKFDEGELSNLFSRFSFPFLFEEVLELDMAEHHRQIANMVCDESFNQVFIKAARGHGKSEEVSVAFVIWLLLTKGSNKAQPYQICLISATDTQMKKLFQRIKNYIESIPSLRKYLYPPNIHNAKWHESEIITRNNVQLIGRPMGPSIRGLHVDLAILDDILTDEVSDVEKAKDIFNGVVSPIIRTKKGRLIVVGTPMSFDDLWSDLFDVEKYPTAHTSIFPARLPDGSVLWKERFSDDELTLIEKNLGPIKWSREYMLTPLGSGAMLFDNELVNNCIDPDTHYLNRSENTEYYLGCDVAISSAKSADFSAFIVVEKNEGEPLRVVDLWHERGVSIPDQIKVIKKLHLQYNFTRIVIEKIGLSYGMVEDLQADSVTRSVTEEFITNLKNKEDILSRLHVLMKNGQLKFFNDENLIRELLTFGIKKKKDGRQTFESLGKHDDLVMALAMVTFAADEYISPYAFEIV